MGRRALLGQAHTDSKAEAESGSPGVRRAHSEEGGEGVSHAQECSMQEAPPHPTQGRTETQRATRWGAACVPQLSHIRPESARQFIQNCFTKSQSEQNQRRSLPETGESLRVRSSWRRSAGVCHPRQPRSQQASEMV